MGELIPAHEEQRVGSGRLALLDLVATFRNGATGMTLSRVSFGPVSLLLSAQQFLA